MAYQRYKPAIPSRMDWRFSSGRPAQVFHAPGHTSRALIQSPSVVYGQSVGMGFSLNPFSLVKSVATAAVGAVKSVFNGSSVSVPGVPGSVPIRDLPRIIRGSTITIGAKQPSAIDQAVESVPGGMATIAVVGLGALALMMLSRRR
jgi:hypothetical protein